MKHSCKTFSSLSYCLFVLFYFEVERDHRPVCTSILQILHFSGRCPPHGNMDLVIGVMGVSSQNDYIWNKLKFFVIQVIRCVMS